MSLRHGLELVDEELKRIRITEVIPLEEPTEITSVWSSDSETPAPVIMNVRLERVVQFPCADVVSGRKLQQLSPEQTMLVWRSEYARSQGCANEFLDLGEALHPSESVSAHVAVKWTWPAEADLTWCHAGRSSAPNKRQPSEPCEPHKPR